MAVGLIAITGALSLVLLLAVARRHQNLHRAELEAQLTAVLSGDAREVLAFLMLPVEGSRVAAAVCQEAAGQGSVRQLRAAVRLVRLHAPALREGLSALATLSRTVAAVVDLPPVSPAAWNAWRLRGLAGLGALLHQVLVAGAERMRLRLWILGEATRLSLRWLRLGAARARRDAGAWHDVSRAAEDLDAAAVELEATYERLVRSLDLVGSFGVERRVRA